jgi:hypothetical protein
MTCAARAGGAVEIDSFFHTAVAGPFAKAC